MKRLFFMIVLPVLWFICLVSPIISKAQFTVGVEGGMGYTNLQRTKGERSVDYHYRAGFSLPYGVFCNYSLSKSFSLQLGVGHEVVGGITDDIHPIPGNISNSGNGDQLYADCNEETKLSYLSASIMLRYSRPIGHNCYPYLQAGISPQLLLSAEQTEQGYGTIYKIDDGYRPVGNSRYFAGTSVVSNDYQAWNWCLVWGGGLYWRTGDDFVSIGIDVKNGFATIQKNDTNGANRTALYSLRVGYGYCF